jgi:exodeoxyribonuclease VII large subunit
MPELPPRTVYAVSELAQLLRGVVEDSFPRVWVSGEISNLSRPASGHWYFTLKDDQAQLRAAMFRNANLHVRPPPKNGDAVLVRAQLSVYTARGDLQLICEHLEPAGEGALLRAFEALKQRLGAEGLFDPALKRPIPPVPRGIGLITSATGAAVQDVLSTLARRFPLVPVWLLPVPVQGEAAAPAIVRALAELPARAPVDVVLLVRGGGSLEDLWAFNEESVARAIRACAVPVISGVGHETDTTIADFAADLRAPTPTAAAEHSTPDLAQWRQNLARLEDALLRPLRQTQARQRLALDQLKARLQRQHPGRRLQDAAQRLDSVSTTLLTLMRRRLREPALAQAQLQQRLQRAAPTQLLRQAAPVHDRLQQRLRAAMQARLTAAAQRTAQASRELQALSPLAVLERGYALVLDESGRVVARRDQAAAADPLTLVLRDGRLKVRPLPD